MIELYTAEMICKNDYRWCSIRRAASSVTTASSNGWTACESSVKRDTISSRFSINSIRQKIYLIFLYLD
jgi:hypothetical protein